MTLPRDLILIIADYLCDGITYARLCQIKPFLKQKAQDNDFWLKLLQREFGQRYSLDLPVQPEWAPLCPTAQAYFQLLPPCPLRRTDIDNQGRLWHMISEKDFNEFPYGGIDWQNVSFIVGDEGNITWSDKTEMPLRALWSFLYAEIRNGNLWLVFQGPKDITVIQHHHVPLDGEPEMERNHLVYLRAGCLEIFTINIVPEGQVKLQVSCALTGVIDCFSHVSFDNPRVQLFEELYMEDTEYGDIFFYLFRTEDGAIYYRNGPFVSYSRYISTLLKKIEPDQEVDYNADCIRLIVTKEEICVMRYPDSDSDDDDDYDDESNEEEVQQDPLVLYKNIR